MSEVSYVDPVFLGFLLQSDSAMRQQGRSLVMDNLPSDVLKLLRWNSMEWMVADRRASIGATLAE